MIIFARPKIKFLPKKHDSLRKSHRTYGLPLENYLPDRVNNFWKCPTAIGEHCDNIIFWSGCILFCYHCIPDPYLLTLAKTDYSSIRILVNL